MKLVYCICVLLNKFSRIAYRNAINVESKRIIHFVSLWRRNTILCVVHNTNIDLTMNDVIFHI